MVQSSHLVRTGPDMDDFRDADFRAITYRACRISIETSRRYDSEEFQFCLMTCRSTELIITSSQFTEIVKLEEDLLAKTIDCKCRT